MYSINYKLGGTTHTLYHPALAEAPNNRCILASDCHLAVNEAGSLTLTVPGDNPALPQLQRMRGVVEVLDGSSPIFRGRIRRDNSELYLDREIECEGMLACLNDSAVPPYNFPEDYANDPEYQTAAASGNVVAFWLGKLLASHNAQVGGEQQLLLGSVTVTDPNNYISRSNDSFSTTWETISSKLFGSALGGYLLIRYEAAGNYVDYVADLPLTNVQTVEFAENMLDVNTDVNGADIFTAVLPVGAEGLTIESLADGDIDSDLVKSGLVVYSRRAETAQGGRITKIQVWDDITIATNLRAKAATMAAGMTLPKAISCKACDLHCADNSIPSFRVGRNVRITSTPHGISGLYPLLVLDFDILNPAEASLDLNRTESTLSRQIAIAKPRDGKDGRDGQDGDDGVSITNVETQYYLSTSDTEPTGGSWGTAVPSVTDGHSLWTRDKVYYSSGASTYTDPMCISKATNEIIAPLTEKVVTMDTTIKKTSSEIVTEALKSYVETSSLEEYKESVSTRFTQTANDFNFEFSKRDESIKKVGDDLQQKYNERAKYIRFVDGDIILGEEGNQITLKIENDRMGFWQSGQEVAWFSNNEFHVTQAEFTTVARIGNFAFVPGAGGNLSFRKVE